MYVLPSYIYMDIYNFSGPPHFLIHPLVRSNPLSQQFPYETLCLLLTTLIIQFSLFCFLLLVWSSSHQATSSLSSDLADKVKVTEDDLHVTSPHQLLTNYNEIEATRQKALEQV